MYCIFPNSIQLIQTDMQLLWEERWARGVMTLCSWGRYVISINNISKYKIVEQWLFSWYQVHVFFFIMRLFLPILSIKTLSSRVHFM